ncbi:MAG: succinate dehydrogenase cytochrome b subunit [Gemmatimonadota bacterium]
MPDTATRAVTRTTIGRKLLMAAASIILFIYILGHLAGNLKIFFGPDSFNHYAEWLRVAGTPLFPDEGVLWVARVVLLVALAVHVLAYLDLWLRKRRARSVGYKKFDPQVFSWTSRTMLWGGIAIFAFVVFHILHLTTGDIQPDPQWGFVYGDPYQNALAGFRVWWVTGFYAVGVIALGMHLYHGLWSALQTFGINNPKYNRYRRPTAGVIAVLITVGYLSIPLAVMTGVIG